MFIIICIWNFASFWYGQYEFGIFATVIHIFTHVFIVTWKEIVRYNFWKSLITTFHLQEYAKAPIISCKPVYYILPYLNIPFYEVISNKTAFYTQISGQYLDNMFKENKRIQVVTIVHCVYSNVSCGKFKYSACKGIQYNKLGISARLVRLQLCRLH